MNVVISSAKYSIYKISHDQFVSTNWHAMPLFLTKTSREISVLSRTSLFKDVLAYEDGWRMLYISCAIPFNSSGILTSLLNPLADKNISVLAISSFDTDHIFFKESLVSEVESILTQAGFKVLHEEE